MANMIEQSLLCKVLDAPDLEILHSNGVIEEMFLTCKDEMAVIYATLIVKGKKTINDVPPVIREQVKQILIDLDLPELAE